MSDTQPNRSGIAVAGPRPTSAERVAVELRSSVLRGDLGPGEHVRQEDWAERLGVSRVPVREAFKMLAAERLLSHDPNRGYFVAKMDASEMEQVYRIRRFLEPEIVRSIRWPEPHELAALERAADRFLEAFVAGDISSALVEEQCFFFGLYDLSPLGFMVNEVKRLWAIADPYRTAAFTATRLTDSGGTSMREAHDVFLDALRRHDHDAIIERILRGRRAVVEYVTGRASSIGDPS